MKNRNGFVSNSSSTSFIVALKKTNIPCPYCGRKDPGLLDLIERAEGHNDDDTHVITSTTVETLDGIMESEFVSQEVKNKVKEYEHKSDWEVVQFCISYHEDALRDILDSLDKSGSAIILDSNE